MARGAKDDQDERGPGRGRPRGKGKAAPVQAAPALEPMDLEALRRVHLFPVRHHSPRAAASLRAFLEEVRPEVVLVEGPADAAELLPALVDEGTVPPVAILAYRTDGESDSALWPFAAYSPEYVALRWAAERGARAELIDLPAGQALAAHGSPLKERVREAAARQTLGPDGAAAPAAEPDRAAGAALAAEPAPEEDPGLDERCARAFGYRSFEELWEARFEAPAYDPAQFRAVLSAWAELVGTGGARPYDLARDALMARNICAVLSGGVAPERVVAVLGAAHVAKLARGDLRPELAGALPQAVPCALTLIPFSFPRLAEQLGYGAGNRAPQYYQRAHEAGCDFRRATLLSLVELTEHLRLRGFAASLSDTIEAYRLALALADLRGKPEPGLDELREASIATLSRGEARPADELLTQSVIGRRVGVVARRVGRNSLQEEFWREVRGRRLPEADELTRFHLHLHDGLQRQGSTFLHRLRVAEVPYAGYLGSGALRAGDSGDAGEAGGVAALGRVRESWQAQWTPATETALVEKIVLGDTLQQVAAQVLSGRLQGARGTGGAAAVLAEAVLVDSPDTVARALSLCESLAATDDDVPSLAQAVRALSGLLSLGGARGEPTGDAGGPQRDLVRRLCQQIFTRAVLRAPGACGGGDEAMGPLVAALRTLHDVALTQPSLDQALWLDAGRAIAASPEAHPRSAGFCCGLLLQAQLLSDEEVVGEVGRRLSSATEPPRAAAFLEGFFEVNAALLCRNRLVVRALDAFLLAIPAEGFACALPVLRRAFSPLQATERRYLLENLIALRGLHGERQAARELLAERDRDALRAMSADLGKVMDDLDELL